MARNAFALCYGALLEDSPGVFKATRFSDEAHFHLSYINKQYGLFWGTQNSKLTVANPLHPERVTVWCASSSLKIFG
jgi:hypothetical protein